MKAVTNLSKKQKKITNVRPEVGILSPLVILSYSLRSAKALTIKVLYQLIIRNFIQIISDNQSPKGIKWSAVHLPCSTCVCIEFFLCFCGEKQGSSPDRGRSPIKWGDFPSICLSVRLSVPPLCLLGRCPKSVVPYSL